MGIVLFLMFLMISHKYYSNFKAGLDGEKQVTDYLSANISDDYYLINDVILPNDNENIDHIITSRMGLFVLETKNNSGTVKFYRGDGWNLNRRSPILQANGNARKLWYFIKDSGILSQTVPYVKGIVVFPRAEITKYDPEALVCKLDELPEYLHRHSGYGGQFSQDQLDKRARNHLFHFGYMYSNRREISTHVEAIFVKND